MRLASTNLQIIIHFIQILIFDSMSRQMDQNRPEA